MGCKKCDGDIEVDFYAYGSVICKACQAANSLCILCGENQEHRNMMACRECLLDDIGACAECDEPCTDDSPLCPDHGGRGGWTMARDLR